MGVAPGQDLAAAFVMRQPLPLEPVKPGFFLGGQVHAFASEGDLARPAAFLGAGKFVVGKVAGACTINPCFYFV
jgi:hypothetical protein